MKEPVIEINNLYVSYNEIPVLENINISIYKNQFLAIIGPNGGGKTTLLKVILGIITPNKGQIKIYGHNIEQGRKLVGYVPQISDFNKGFPINVQDVILMGRLSDQKGIFHNYSKKDYQVANDIMKELDIINLKNRQIGKLSGGQLQRVLIGRALASDPKILLLDEPTASLDAESRNNIYNILRDINDEMTILVVTHDLTAVSSYFDSIACLNKNMHYHGGKNLSKEDVNQVYGCPVDFIAHGIPHRVLGEHEGGSKND